MGFGSGSIGHSLESCAAGAALVLVLLLVVVSLLLFLCSPLCTSSASASLITSRLRSSLSAPCAAILRHSSIRTLQRSEWVCAILLSLTVLQLGHPTGACLAQNSCSFTWQWKGLGSGPLKFSGLSTVHLPSVILQGTPFTLLTASLSHLL